MARTAAEVDAITGPKPASAAPRETTLPGGRRLLYAPAVPCVHLGGATGETYRCSCGGGGTVKLFACALYGECEPSVGVTLVRHAANDKPLPRQCSHCAADGQGYEPR